TRGNRVFLGGRDGLHPAPFAAELAEGGWAWGVAPFDLENDGRPDFHLANGHETRASVTDYERQFWLDDLHAAGSAHEPVADAFFRAQAGRRVQRQASYGGWQNSALFWNGGDGRFTEAAWLLGSAVPADSRHAVADDFDGDGRLDLAVTTFEEYPVPRQRLKIFLNETAGGGHWLGFTFPEGPGRPSPLNARVTVETATGNHHRWIVCGDSFRSHGRRAVHFGLGQDAALKQGSIQWPDGRAIRLGAPALDQWHPVMDPPGGQPPAAR
ncbi:MAG: CRTAC1 family protein, partial [Verrucomicrobiota bacterium]